MSIDGEQVLQACQILAWQLACQSRLGLGDPDGEGLTVAAWVRWHDGTAESASMGGRGSTTNEATRELCRRLLERALTEAADAQEDQAA